MHPFEALVVRLRRDAGEVSSWLLVAAALAAAALGAGAILQATIGQLASDVGEGAGVAVEAGPPPRDPAAAGGRPVDGDDRPTDNTSNHRAPEIAPDGGTLASGGDSTGGRGGGDGTTDQGGRGGDSTTDEEADPPTPVDHDGDLVANGVEFTIGPYQEPDIQHDNGHLQDQSDPTNPVPEPTREPTQEEIDYYNAELDAVTLGDRTSWLPLDWIDDRFGWDNAIPAYRHFLEGDGADRTFDMDAYLNDDPNGGIVEQSLRDDAMAAIDLALGDLATSGDLPVGESVTFTITSDPVTTSETSRFYPYPSTVDWQRTVGGMQVWTTSEVVATRQADGTVDITTSTTIHGEDRYNFNWNQQAIDNGEPDWLRGRLEIAGLAHQYTQTGSTERSDEWTLDLP